MKKFEAKSQTSQTSPRLRPASRAALPYRPDEIELKWQSKWQKEGIYQPDIKSANGSASSPQGRPFYNLMMFPYPSAEGLHMGSIYTFTGVDVYGRFKRMQGYDVFEPIGLDGFGIHSENHAIKTNSHPIEHAQRTEQNFYRQLQMIGNGFAWENKLETYDPGYYKWTQWIFIELFKAGLAYRKKSPVNFCPHCKTVLADEQVIDTRCERCDNVVEKRELEQWFFKITSYAERLLNNIEDLDWTEKIKLAQKNWIGRSEGSRIEFKIQNSKFKIAVFTTRPDTLYGVTFLVISPEHELVGDILKHIHDDKKLEFKKYIEETNGKSEIERQAEGKEKTGVFSGLYAINPVNGEEIPVWVADYVLGGYGTGAIMAVPAHDQRDFEFAQKYHLPIKTVIASQTEFDLNKQEANSSAKIGEAYKGSGVLINSGDWNGWEMPDEKEKVLVWLEEKGLGKRESNYHLRDWLISRQRYWGPPIPMIYCESCAEKGLSWFTSNEAKARNQESGIRNSSFAEASADKQELRDKNIENWKLGIENSAAEAAGWYPEENLPVELPFLEDYKPMGTGKAPLANSPEFYETICPHCGSKARRETDVSDTFLDSSWYFLRYLFINRDDVAFSNSQFLPVTMYIGGAEHAVLHLLYARFVTMVLHDLGYLDFEEPFARFYAHGLIIKDGAKMSKSKGNVINPDEYIKKYGVDSVRLYLRFLGPFDQTADFRDSGIEGMSRFVKRLWNLFTKFPISNFQFPISNERKSMMHRTIKDVTEEMEHLRFNTAIAKLMSWYNFLVKEEHISREEVETYLKLLAPFAPHMTEELYQQFFINSKFSSIHLQPWPSYDEKYVQDKRITIAVQVNGKLRGTFDVSIDQIQDAEDMKRLGRSQVENFLVDQNIKTVIYVPGKIVNFVIG